MIQRNYKRNVLIAALLLYGSNALTQINTYAVNQTVTYTTGIFIIDVDGDGTDDFSFQILPLSPTSNAARVNCLGNSRMMDNSTFGYPDALNFDDPVTSPYSGGAGVLGTDVGGGGLFSGAGVRYLGLNIDIAGNSHLGWIALEVPATNDTIYIYDVGYNTTADDGINAGQVSLIGVDEINYSEWAVSPNPCQDQLRISHPNSVETVSYFVADLVGKTKFQGIATENIDVSELTAGSYILTVYEGSNMIQIKFVKD